ncbi:MAG: peptidoglycan-binding domain-containing protein [Pseudomonadota bacterium]
MTLDELKAELRVLRARVKTAFATAKAQGDAAEMTRLTGIAVEIDLMLDNAALLALAQRVRAVADLRSKIDGQARAVDPGLDTGSLAELEDMLDRIMGQTGEEELPLRDALGPAGGAAATPIEPPPLETVAAVDPGPDPAGRLLLSEAHLLALWKRSLFPIDSRGLIVFGLRGCRPVEISGTAMAMAHEITPTPVNLRTMNCTLGHWRPGAGLALFPGSTVPFGPAVEKRIAQNGVGVNQMGRGRYKRYTAGWHKRSEGPAGHWALRQECAITLQRTGDDADFDLLDRWEEGRIAGDNIHCAFHMGFDGGSAVAGFSSLGCQTVAGTVKKGVKGSEAGPWRSFIAPFADELGGQERCEYVLFGADEAQQMIRTRMAGKTVILRMGSSGPLVAQLQAALNDRAQAGLKVDGDFGAGTFRAVIDFQTAEFGPEGDDGIVGPGTAARLGLTLPPFDFAAAIAGGPGHEPPGGAGPAGPGAGPDGDPDGGPDGGPDGDAPEGVVGAIASGTPLAWGKITRDKHGQAFNDRVIEIANGLRADPNHLMAAMAFESADTFRTDIRNPISNATGLIQFMDFTAEELGTTLDALAAMTGLEQLDFVERYFAGKARGRPLTSLSDIYMAILWPKAIGELESFVLFSQGEKAYEQNKPLDVNKNGAVTKAEATSKVQGKLVLGMKANRFG